MNFSRLREIPVCRAETRQWFWLTLAYVGVRALRFPYHLRLRSGEVFILRERMDLVVFWLVFVRRHYPVSSADTLIIDVGANVGFFTVYAARQAPAAHILALEPFPETFRRLTELIADNRLEQRVRALNCALGSRAGTALMDGQDGTPSQYRALSSALTRRLNIRHKNLGTGTQKAEAVTVRTVTLSQLLADHETPAVDLIKLNIHGNEYEVLLSTPPEVLKRFRRVAVQYHEVPADLNLGKGHLFKHFTEAGFELILDSDTQRGAGLAVLERMDSPA